MTVAPLEYVVVRLDDDQFTGEILSVLDTIQQAGSVQVVDLLFVSKDDAGAVTAREVRDPGDAGLDHSYAVFGEALQGLLTAEDVATLAADVPVTESAVIVLLEHRWAQGLGEAVSRAGGSVVTGGLVSPDALARLNLELAPTAAQ